MVYGSSNEVCPSPIYALHQQPLPDLHGELRSLLVRNVGYPKGLGRLGRPRLFPSWSSRLREQASEQQTLFHYSPTLREVNNSDDPLLYFYHV